MLFRFAFRFVCFASFRVSKTPDDIPSRGYSKINHPPSYERFDILLLLFAFYFFDPLYLLPFNPCSVLIRKVMRQLPFCHLYFEEADLDF